MDERSVRRSVLAELLSRKRRVSLLVIRRVLQIQPDTFARAIHALEDDGLIIRDGLMVVTSPAALRRGLGAIRAEDVTHLKTVGRLRELERFVAPRLAVDAFYIPNAERFLPSQGGGG